MAKQYLNHSVEILSSAESHYKSNRTGIDSISLFGYQNQYNLSEGFPLLTTKRVPIKAITHELIWFLRGDTNIKYLVDNDVHIWDDNSFQHYLKAQNLEGDLAKYSDGWIKAKQEFIENIKENFEFSERHGNLGDIYGAQWRKWKTSEGKEIDQLGDIVEMIQNKPSSRRIIVSAWNPEEVPNMALPPCHTLYHINVADGKLDLQLYQRSCDMFLGVPFNIASYAMLTQILAQQANLKLGRFIHTFGDSHFYCGEGNRGKWYENNLEKLKEKVRVVRDSENISKYQDVLDWINQQAPEEQKGLEGQDHVTAILEQLTRRPRQFPKIVIANKKFDELTIDDFSLEEYNPYPIIKRAMAV